MVAEYGSVRLLLYLDDLEGIEPAAVLADFRFGQEHVREVERLAIVGDSRLASLVAEFSRPFYSILNEDGTVDEELEPDIESDLLLHMLPDFSRWGEIERVPLIVAFDHRVVDGADAARFMNVIVDVLEDPDKWRVVAASAWNWGWCMHRLAAAVDQDRFRCRDRSCAWPRHRRTRCGKPDCGRSARCGDGRPRPGPGAVDSSPSDALGDRGGSGRSIPWPGDTHPRRGKIDPDQGAYRI